MAAFLRGRVRSSEERSVCFLPGGPAGYDRGDFLLHLRPIPVQNLRWFPPWNHLDRSQGDLCGYAIKFILTPRVAWLVGLFSFFIQGEVLITSVFHDGVLLIALVCVLISRLSLLRQAPSLSCTRLKRKALAMTLTEDIAIAAAPMTGESRMPKKGYSTPAAIGTPAAL
jgi:hypothetical protein